MQVGEESSDAMTWKITAPGAALQFELLSLKASGSYEITRNDKFLFKLKADANGKISFKNTVQAGEAVRFELTPL